MLPDIARSLRHRTNGQLQRISCYDCAMPPSRRAVVLGLAALLALQAQAAITTVPIPSREVQDLIQLPDGRLAVSGSTTDWRIDERTGQLADAPVSHSFVHIVDPRAATRKDIEVRVPPYGSAVPYRKGFAAWGRNAASFEVHYFEVEQLPRESILHSADELDYLYLAAPPAGDSLYVAESLRRGGMRLIRFDSSGRQAWTRSYENVHPTGVTAVSDGVVFIRPDTPHDNEPRGLLTKVGLDGAEAWSSRAAYGMGGVPTVRFHSRKVISVANAAADESVEFVNYDSGSGRQISKFTFPGFAKLVGTEDGLLLIHSYMYRPYIALLDPAGSMRWWRRYTPAGSVGVPVSGLISQSGRLALLTQNADNNAEPANNVVLMQANGKELSRRLSDCTRRDPLPVLRMEHALRARYAVAVSLDYNLIVPPASGCPHPTEDEYASAVSAIADQFVNRAETRNPWAEQVYVRIMGSGPAMRLDSYYIGMGPTDSAERQIGFEIRYDTANAFARYLRETVFPHMARIEAARLRFTELTGQTYGAHAPEGELPDPDEFFAQMERATEVLEARVRAVDSSAWPRPRLLVGAILYPTQFGGSLEKMKPLEVADQTLIELIENAKAGRR